MKGLSGCIITHNEVERISGALNSLSACDEVVVLDHFSTDGTPELARQFANVRLIQKPFLGFRTQREILLSETQCDWIVYLDSDEQLDSEARNFLSSRSFMETTEKAYRIPVKLFYFNRWLRYGGWYPHYKIRLFHRSHIRFQGAEVHEFAEPIQTSVGRWSGNINHYSFKNITHQVQKYNQVYSSNLGKVTAQKKAVGLGTLVTRPLYAFFWKYAIRLGFLDGIPGFIMAANYAHYTFLKYAKAWEVRDIHAEKRV